MSFAELRSVAVAVLAVWLAAGCGGGASVTDQIKETIAEMEQLAEEGKRRPFMAFVADDFQGQGGMMTRDDFQALLVMQWNQYRRLRAQIFPIEVRELGPSTADATFRVLVTGGQGLLPQDGQLYDVRTSWLKESGEWLLWRATWEPAGT